MKIGIFYQCGYRFEACFFALKQFRKFYPTAPIALYEDNTDILQPIAKKFHCVYKKTDKNGYISRSSGRPAYNLDTTLSWLARVYDSCCTTLKNTDWVVHFEDDVWFKNKLIDEPPYDLCGIRGIGAHIKFYEYFNAQHHATYGCGGSVFNREKFILAYDKSKDIDWNFIDNLATNNNEPNKNYPKPSMWTDSALTLIFLNAGFSVGPWNQLAQYFNPEGWFTQDDRKNWIGDISQLEMNQPQEVNILHCWKPYYYPTDEEKKQIELELKN